MTVHWRKFIFKINEFYNMETEGYSSKRADLHINYQLGKLNNAITFTTVHRQELHLCIDLSKAEETLLQEMNRTTRYKIRRAKRDNLTIKCNMHPNEND